MTNSTDTVDAGTPSRPGASLRTFRSAAAEITSLHRDTIERLQRLPLNEIDPRLQADAEDLETRAERLRCHLLIVKDYVDGVLADTAGQSWSVHVDRRWIEDSFRDLIQSIVGPIEVAAETVRQEGSYCAP
jgi:hypothetical protein